MDTSNSDLQAIRQMLADLTARVYRIERKLGMETAGVETRPSAAEISTPPKSRETAPDTASSLPSPTVRSSSLSSSASGLRSQCATSCPSRVRRTRNPNFDLESRIGSHWLNRIGIAALLIGISYFLKFAFDNNWIGPAGRVAIGLLAGIAVVIWSERFRSKGYQAFSYSLKAVGIGAMYLSLWAAFQVYSLVPSGVAFVMMLAVTAATAAMALAQDAQILAAFALAGGFSTPLLLSTGQNREIALFSYVAILDLATLALVTFKPWRRLLVMSYAGTLLLYWWLVFPLLQPQRTQSYARLRHAILRNFRNCAADHAATRRRVPAPGFHSRRSRIRECRHLFPAGLRHDR